MEIDIQKILPEKYSRNLRELPQPPRALWLRGTLPGDQTRLLAVVGSRALTRYGREACEMLIGGLKNYPISIVSGLALGADACAHESALKAGLHTIAIPGSGLADSSIGPRSNFSLAQRILASGGALLSEHEPDYQAHPYDFPSRNRIMVGLADAVLIVEAGPKSGTLITARLAGEYNRELLCVPHRIGDPHGFGSHLFLRQGATLVENPLHILEALRIPIKAGRAEDCLNTSTQKSAFTEIIKNLTEQERKIYTALELPLSRDELIRSITLPVQQTLTILMTLEFKGILKEEFGAWRRV